MLEMLLLVAVELEVLGEVGVQLAQLRGVLDLVLRLPEDQAEHSARLPKLACASPVAVARSSAIFRKRM